MEMIWGCFGRGITGRKKSERENEGDKIVLGTNWFSEKVDSVHGQPGNPESTSIWMGSDGPASVTRLHPALPEAPPDEVVDKLSDTGPFELGKVLAVVVEHHDVDREEDIGDVFVLDIFGLDNAENVAIVL